MPEARSTPSHEPNENCHRGIEVLENWIETLLMRLDMVDESARLRLKCKVPIEVRWVLVKGNKATESSGLRNRLF